MTQNALPQQPQSPSAIQQANGSSVMNALVTNTQPDTAAIASHVEISTEKRPGRERRILASILIPQPVEQVWQVVTDYERLADFVPSLTSSKLLPNSEGRIRLEQIGAQCFLRVKFCARVVLDMTEHFPHKVSFSMQEGDFKQFEGAWQLEPTDNTQATRLSYDLFVKAPLAMPTALIEHHIRHNLIVNMLAIRQRSLELAAQ
ncbi:MAG: SRPBCC family protein [Cyanobacteria bacterium J06623_4]